MTRKQWWRRGPDWSLNNQDMSLYCSSAVNSSAVAFIKATFPTHSTIYNFDHQKWMKFPELQNYLYGRLNAMHCYAASSFNKDGKQNLMVLTTLVDKTTFDSGKLSYDKKVYTHLSSDSTGSPRVVESH